MIGVIAKPAQRAIVEEFFELFKTPWQAFDRTRPYDVVISTVEDCPDVDARLLIVFGADANSLDDRCHIDAVEPCDALPLYGARRTFADGAAVVRLRSDRLTDTMVLRVGYDLFDEAAILLSAGQPLAHASVPTLDRHIARLRRWIVQAGVPLVEVPPIPAGGRFFACLTHDIDFVGIRPHRFDHTMLGFVYRATIGAVASMLRGRLTMGKLLKNWAAAASLPAVYLGLANDFWRPFEWYFEVERGLPATYFLIPFKRRTGENVPGPVASRRATAYDVTDIPADVAQMLKAGNEVGVHGIDAWHSVDAGRVESERVSAVADRSAAGIRMHWLLNDASTPSVLDQAGYAYDSTSGYNDTVGFKAGTTQVFRPLGAKTLLELPMHIQDGALFYPNKLDLSEHEAATRCGALLDHAAAAGGALTVLWHDRSHAPERFWGSFYVQLIDRIRRAGAYFATAADTAEWFRRRRAVTFAAQSGAGVQLVGAEAPAKPAFTVRLHLPGEAVRVRDFQWDGAAPFDTTAVLRGDDRSRVPFSTARVEAFS